MRIHSICNILVLDPGPQKHADQIQRSKIGISIKIMGILSTHLYVSRFPVLAARVKGFLDEMSVFTTKQEEISDPVFKF